MRFILFGLLGLLPKWSRSEQFTQIPVSFEQTEQISVTQIERNEGSGGQPAEVFNFNFTKISVQNIIN